MNFLSGRPGSNRRHSAWKADALPTELLPLIHLKFVISNLLFQNFNELTIATVCLDPPLADYQLSYSRNFMKFQKRNSKIPKFLKTVSILTT